SKLKFATAVLAAVGILGAGAALFAQQALADKPAERPVKEKSVQLAQISSDRPARENKESAPIPANINGIVKSVDAANSALTVTYGVGESTFHLAADARIEIDGKAGQLSAVPAGANVNISQFVDAATARSVRANGRWYFGSPVKAVDPERNTITIEVNREGAK